MVKIAPAEVTLEVYRECMQGILPGCEEFLSFIQALLCDARWFLTTTPYPAHVRGPNYAARMAPIAPSGHALTHSLNQIWSINDSEQ